MSPQAIDFWRRALDAMKAARYVLVVSPDTAASRAYYAAFYAVSALPAEEGQHFRKHAAVEASVHRELVGSGRWARELGEGYSRLARLRSAADYGGDLHVSPEDAKDAIATAGEILRAVAEADPMTFGGLEGN